MNRLLSVLKAHGFRYFAFRSCYELQRRTGLLRYQYPTRYGLITNFTLTDFRGQNRFFFDSRETLSIEKRPSDCLQQRFLNIMKGKIRFFSHMDILLGNDYDWVTNPLNEYRYDSKQHWTQIEDLDDRAGDIKFVWEKSRFSYIYTVLRYDYHFDQDHSSWVFQEISTWIDKNPLNQGPNYKCSQEISIRVLNWIFVLYFYKYSSALTDPIFQKIINSIYGQIKHIENNIDFSRICVRNNHAITETLTLYLTSLIFPDFPGAAKRKRMGKKYFEEEIDFQVADDGTFIQDSMNYHRVVIQLLSWAIAIADVNRESYVRFVYEKAFKSVNFLYQCQEQSNGWLPNYGANDGALFFPLNDADYRDFRPQLDALHHLLTGKGLYTESYEDTVWYKSQNLRGHGFKVLSLKYGVTSFEDSGYFLFREPEMLFLIRCGGFNGGEGTNDQMHMDVWYRGVNVFCDAGSYQYNTSKDLALYFQGTESHNCVMLGDCHLSQKGIRFIWNDPPIIKNVEVKEIDENFSFVGEVEAFRYLQPDIVWKRRISVSKITYEISVKDSFYGKPHHLKMRQIWHLPTDYSIQMYSDAVKIEKMGKCSDYYGGYHINKQVEFVTENNSIETKIEL